MESERRRKPAARVLRAQNRFTCCAHAQVNTQAQLRASAVAHSTPPAFCPMHTQTHTQNTLTLETLRLFAQQSIQAAKAPTAAAAASHTVDSTRKTENSLYLSIYLSVSTSLVSGSKKSDNLR